MRAINKLTETKAKAETRPGLHADGNGLYLQVTPTGTKSWVFRYMADLKQKKLGLGPYPIVTLADARKKAMECQRQRHVDGIDPLDRKKAERSARRVERAKVMTFKQCAEAYIASHRAGWKNIKHAAQWEATLKTYAYPTFGDLPVAEVDTGLVMKAIEPMWTKTPETATRVRGRIESILGWATTRGFRQGDNPARWRGHLDNLLPKRSKVAKVQHHPALPYAEIGEFLTQVRALEGVGARALEFAILTAARTGEVVNARWSEIDLDARMWTIPGERMKAGKEHRVPLSDRAIAILKGLPREKGTDFVFIGDKKGKALSNMALLMTLRRMKRDDLTVHGFRSTFRDWAAEQTAYPNEMVEMALAHTIGDKTEAAYRRGDMVEKRRRLMADWAAFCARGSALAPRVVPIRGGVNA